MNPRRVVLRDLRAIASLVRTMVATWNQAQTMYVPETQEGEVRRHIKRKRRPDEKVENQPEQWGRLAVRMKELAKRANDIERFARIQLDEANARKEILR